MPANHPGIGFVSVDGEGYWPGGRYYLHHVIRSVALLPQEDRPPMRDVWWLAKNQTDTSFDAVREHLAESVVVRPPRGFAPRLARRLARLAGAPADFGDLFRATGVDVLFPTSACERPGAPMVYWLTDFQHKRRPDLFTRELLDWFDHNFSTKVRDAELVMLSSKDAHADFIRYFPKYAHKARLVIFASVPHAEWFAVDPRLAAREYGLFGDYFVLPNQFTEHKNHLVVFEAVRILKARGLNVQVACTGHSLDYKGKKHVDRLLRYISDQQLGDSIRVLGFLPQSIQMAIYRGSRAVLQPSQFEGWSGALEDARSLGRKMIVSDIPIHREKNVGDLATFVDPSDVEVWANALGEMWRDNSRTSKENEDAAVAEALSRATVAGREFVGLMREANMLFQTRRVA